MRAAPPSFRLFAPRFARTVHLEIRGLSPDSAVSPTDKATVVVSLRPTGPRLRSTSTSPPFRPLPVVVEISRSR
jgi:hypothetical protein